MSHLQRQLKQINSVTGGSNSNHSGYNHGGSYPRDREQFKEKVMSEHDHHRRVSVKNRGNNKPRHQYSIDNRRNPRRGNYNDFDDPESSSDRHRPDAKQITRQQNKNPPKKTWRDKRPDRNWDRIDVDDIVNEDIQGKHDWVRIQMTIPRPEQSRRIEFQQEMLTKFSAQITNFADKDAHCESNNVMFFIPFEHSEMVHRQMIDVINDIRPAGISTNNFIKVRKFPAHPPISARFENITNAEQILTAELGKSYDTNTNTLDLSNWSTKANLLQQGMKMQLNKGEHMALLVRMLAVFPIDNMTGLNMSNNNLRNLQQLAPLVPRLPNLKELILKGNSQIRNWDDLKWVQGWKIEKLDVTECQLSKSVGGRNAIKQSKEARRVFKNLKSFNGKELCVSFDLDTSETADSDVNKLPAKLDSVLPDADGLEGPLIEFVAKFIDAFDNNREALYHCYASDTIFTLCVGRGTDLQSYRKHQRNLVNYKHFVDPQNTDKYRNCHPNTIKRKKLLVIATLEELPQTKHDLLNSTLLDVTLQVPSIIGFTLSGTFKEVESGTVRFFSRHILCTFNPTSKSFVISHDQFYIRAATEKETSNHGVKQPFEKQPSKPSTSGSTEQNDIMIKKFMHESGMVEKYARMCLEENHWNYNKAAEKFLDLKTKSVIPADAWQSGRQP